MFEQVLRERAGPTGGLVVLPGGHRPPGLAAAVLGREDDRCMTVIHKLSTPS
jgi:hypothetical protein